MSYTYDAWGKPLHTTGSLASTLGAANPLRYRGYVYDSETGLYYLGSRYYDPGVGRFISADDVSMLGANGTYISLNNFAYCLNNPVNRIDENGELPILLVVFGLGFLAGGLGQLISDAITSIQIGKFYMSRPEAYFAASTGGGIGAMVLTFTGDAKAASAMTAMVTTFTNDCLENLTGVGNYALREVLHDSLKDGLIAYGMEGLSEYLGNVKEAYKTPQISLFNTTNPMNNHFYRGAFWARKRVSVKLLVDGLALDIYYGKKQYDRIPSIRE